LLETTTLLFIDKDCISDIGRWRSGSGWATAGDGASIATPRFSSSIANKRAFNKVISSSIDIPADTFFSESHFIDMAGVSEYAGAGVGHGSCSICGVLALNTALFSGKYDDSIGPAWAEKVGLGS